MCGRFTLTVPTYAMLAEVLGLPYPEAAPDYRPRYNIAPSDPAWILRAPEGTRQLELAGWGLVPWWSKARADAGRPINARAESVATKPAFRDAFARGRCIVVADGFFEWRRVGREREPIWFRPASGGLLLFGGASDAWKDPESGERSRTFSIVTTAANEDVTAIHDRMPLVIDPREVGAWLSADASPSDLSAILRPAKAGALTLTAVSKRVNSVKNDDLGCVAPFGSDLDFVTGREEPAPKGPRSRKTKTAPDAQLGLFAAAAKKGGGR